MRKSPKFSPEVVDRAVRMVFEAKDQYPSQWAAIESIAGKMGCTAETLRRWVRQGERDRGDRPGATTAEAQRIKVLEREVRGARATQGQRDLEAGQRVFRPGGARPPTEVVMQFVAQQRERFGVEPICRALQIAPSACWRAAARAKAPNGAVRVSAAMGSLRRTSSACGGTTWA
jgi:transposase